MSPRPRSRMRCATSGCTRNSTRHAGVSHACQHQVLVRRRVRTSVDLLAMKQPLWFTNVATAADDVALIAFTSGTTGKPGHDALPSRCGGDVRLLSALDPEGRQGRRLRGTPPLAFTFGLGGLLCFPMRVGASTVLVEKHTPETLLQTIGASSDRLLRRAGDVSSDGGDGGALRPFIAAQMRLRRRGAARCDTAGVQADRNRDHRRHRLDRDDPHLHFAHARARVAAPPATPFPGTRPPCSMKTATLAAQAGRLRSRARRAAVTSPTTGKRTTFRTVGT